MARSKDKIRFRINANGAEVFSAGHWYPADSSVLENVTKILKQGLPLY